MGSAGNENGDPAEIGFGALRGRTLAPTGPKGPWKGLSPRSGSRGVDRLDMAILGELRLEPFMGKPRERSPWRPSWLAPRVGATERLVKDRLRRLKLSGFLAGFEVFPNLAALGFASRSYAFGLRSRREKQALLSGARDLEGYLGHIDFLTPWVHVTLADRGGPDRERKQRLLVRLAGGQEPSATFVEPAFPIARAPSALDWRLLRALRGDARRSPVALGRHLHASPRTVQRRLDRLARDGAFDTCVRLGPNAFDHMLLCTVVLRLDRKRPVETVKALHRGLYADAWSFCDAGDPRAGQHTDLVAAPRSPSEIQAFLREAEQLEGVIEAEGHVVSSLHWDPAWLDEQIDARARP